MTSLSNNQPITVKRLSDTEYEEKVWEHLGGSEGKISRIYSDQKGIPTMGAGVALAVTNKAGTYVLRDRNDIGTMISGDSSKPYAFSEQEWKLLEDVTETLNDNSLKTKEVVAKAQALIPPYNYSKESKADNKFNFELTPERIKATAIEQFGEHRKLAMTDVRKEARELGWSEAKIKDYVEKLQSSDQGIVLTSLRYGGFKSPDAIKALLTGDRPAFRDEILYDSNNGGSRNLGLAIRRQKEADMATGDPANWSEEEQKKWREIENGENAMKNHREFREIFPGKPVPPASESVPAKPESSLPNGVDPGQYLNNPDQVGEVEFGVQPVSFGFLGEDDESPIQEAEKLSFTILVSTNLPASAGSYSVALGPSDQGRHGEGYY